MLPDHLVCSKLVRRTVARVINVAASLPHFWMSLSTLMIRFTRKRGSCVVSSRPCDALLALGGGVGVIPVLEMAKWQNVLCVSSGEFTGWRCGGPE